GFYRPVSMSEARPAAVPAVSRRPVGAEGHYRGIVDLVTMTAKIWDEGMGEDWKETDIPVELESDALEWRTKLLDGVASHDDDLMEKYLSDEELDPEEIKAVIRK